MLREGRLTEGQRRALQELWPRYGIDLTSDGGPVDLTALFGRAAPVFVEIGFGNGEALAGMAARHPERNCLGIEVHRPGVGRLLLQVAKQDLANVRVIRADAVEVLSHHIPDASLDGVSIFFPDPWPKPRHHKRRLVSPDFGRLVAAKLKTGGLIHLATDWEHYATQMLAVMTGTPGLVNTAEAGRFVPCPERRPLTRFEHRGQRLGHGVWDLIFRRA